MGRICIGAWEQIELITISISNAENCCMFGRDKMVFGGDKQSKVETCKIWYDKEVFVGSAVYKNVDNKIESLKTNSIWMIGRAG